MTARRVSGGGDSGSIFVEAVIAAAIVAMALGGTFRVSADGAARGRAADGRREALLVAESQLAAVGADIPLRQGDSAGLAGDLVWRVQVTREDGDSDANPAGVLWRVAVTVAPREGGPTLASLKTLRLGPAAG